jgi:hypothetical protein
MHTLQWIVTTADDKDHAFRSVKHYLEAQMGMEENYSSWYDWFVTGGGRWNSNPDSQYNDDDQSMVISYDEEPQKFLEAVENAIQSRKEEFDRYAKDVNPEVITKIISNYNPNDKDYALFSEMYPIKKIVDMAYGEWDFNSYYFDCDTETTTPAYMLESIDKGNKNWYAVPVDFHF